MKVGDSVVHRNEKKYGKGRILAINVHQGTVLVKFEHFKSATYHIPWVLTKV